MKGSDCGILCFDISPPLCILPPYYTPLNTSTFSSPDYTPISIKRKTKHKIPHATQPTTQRTHYTDNRYSTHR